MTAAVEAYAVALSITAEKLSPEGELACRVHGMASSLRQVGWAGDIVCLTHGRIGEHASLQQACTHRLVASHLPAYDAGPTDANTSTTIDWYVEHGRVPPPAHGRVQTREDGRATALKFFAWSLTRYAMILHADLDVLFLESPLPVLRSAHRQGALFYAAHVERGKRGFDGLNTHMIVLRPSLELFALLTSNAAAGHFIPYTRTEQDVIESVLTRSVGLAGGGLNASRLMHASWNSSLYFTRPVLQLPSHLHYFKHGCTARHCCGKVSHHPILARLTLALPLSLAPPGSLAPSGAAHPPHPAARVHGHRPC